jgi:hypothetical protein
MQDISSVKIMDESMTIDKLILLVSRTKVEALAVHRMISCFLALSPRFSTLMSCNVDGVECLTAAP